MLILTCKTKDKRSEFILLPSTQREALLNARKMNDLGCEPVALYIGEDDETKYKEWIMTNIKNSK